MKTAKSPVMCDVMQPTPSLTIPCVDHLPPAVPGAKRSHHRQITLIRRYLSAKIRIQSAEMASSNSKVLPLRT
eukprot:Skav216420  [mRNA]  locus=scaffold3139:45206:46716:+ [translate_table: standard]